MRFPLEITLTLKEIKSYFNGLYDQQNLALVVISYEMTTRVRSSIYTTREKKSGGTVMWEKSCRWRQRQWGHIHEVHVLFHVQASCSLNQSYFHGN